MDKLTDSNNQTAERRGGLKAFFLQIKESIKSLCDGAREEAGETNTITPATEKSAKVADIESK